MSHIKRFIAAGLTLATVASLLPMTSLAANNSWVEKDGKWYYYDQDGKKVKYDSMPRWVDGEGYKYYVLNSKGVQVTSKGWYTTNYIYTYYYNKIKIQNKYYLKSDGSVTTGWKKISKKWYYFEYDGKMAKGVVRKEIDSSGKEKHYLLGNDGARITKKGWHQVTYVDFSESYGTKTTSKYWYYVKSDGTIYRNCIKTIKGKKYLFDDEGRLVCNDIGGVRDESTGDIKTYYSTDKNGVIYTKKGWRTIKITYTDKYYSYSLKENVTVKVYVKTGGKLQTGLKTIKGKTYYFYPSMAVCDYEYVDNVKYYFGRSGACTKKVDYNVT